MGWVGRVAGVVGGGKKMKNSWRCLKCGNIRVSRGEMARMNWLDRFLARLFRCECRG